MDEGERNKDVGQLLIVQGCRADRAELFAYTSSGLLITSRGCLVIAGAAANALLSLQNCDATKPTHRWIVTH